MIKKNPYQTLGNKFYWYEWNWNSDDGMGGEKIIIKCKFIKLFFVLNRFEDSRDLT